ncbi:unnamed protein product [Prorocentrum cordatum]|uniref:Uncharacterized protein n=1 Tax=Prorocentrum cordatum TaxID=2364126 RepID=A0ABN9V5J5_9DINO|nr:unnamed protein product [Polarella glacialis]
MPRRAFLGRPREPELPRLLPAPAALHQHHVFAQKLVNTHDVGPDAAPGSRPRELRPPRLLPAPARLHQHHACPNKNSRTHRNRKLRNRTHRGQRLFVHLFLRNCWRRRNDPRGHGAQAPQGPEAAQEASKTAEKEGAGSAAAVRRQHDEENAEAAHLSLGSAERRKPLQQEFESRRQSDS